MIEVSRPKAYILKYPAVSLTVPFIKVESWAENRITFAYSIACPFLSIIFPDMYCEYKPIGSNKKKNISIIDFIIL